MKNDLQNYLDLIEDTGNIGYWRLNLKNNDIFWSPGIYRIHGVSKNAYKPNLETAIEFYHSDDRKAVIAFIEKAITNKQGGSFDLRIVRADGAIRNIRSTFKCLIDNKGDVETLLGIFQDMTEQIKVNKEIEESRNFLKTIIDCVPDLIFVKDRQSRLVLGNKAFWSLYADPPEKLIGTTTFEKFPEEEAKMFKERDESVFSVGEDETEETITDKDGMTKAYVTKKIIFKRHDEQPFLLGVSRDISQRRLYEEQIKNYSSEMEIRNMNLEQSNKALEDYAHTAAHDLKEPVRSIHSYIEMILYDHKDIKDDVKKSLKKVMDVCKHMEQMVNELLLFSEISQTNEDFIKTDLNQVLKNEIAGLQTRIDQENAVINVQKLAKIKCHPTRVGEIFRNLIINALKYNNQTQKIIDIGCYNEGTKTVFFVKDNGIGIKNSHHDKIFKIFKRLHGKMLYGGGTGIGLAITKKIVEMHNGQIWLESKEGLGSTFYFTLQ